MRGFSFLVLVLSLASPVCAAPLGTPSDGYVYFHHAGADMAAHNAVLEACAGVAAATLAPDMFGATGGGTGLLERLANDEAAHVNFVANVENCVVAHGWDVVRLDDAEGSALAALDEPRQAAALTPWVGAAQVHGAIVRRYARIDELQLVSAAFMTSARDSLSQMADRSHINVASITPDADRKPEFQNIPAAGDPAQIPDGASVIVVRAHTIAPAQASLTLLHVGDGAGLPDVILIATPTRLFWSSGSSLEKTYAFVVPAGRWHIAGITGVGFCLGGPTFDVQPGEAVFAGTFDAPSPFTMALAMDAAKAALGASALAQRLHPARYVNGMTFDCAALPQTLTYVFELPGAPFVDGYANGSRAVLSGALMPK